MSPPVAVTPITAHHVPYLARIHLDAFPGSESTLLGRRYARAFVAWFAGRGDAIALVAVVGAAPVGYVFGAEPERLRQLYRSLLPVVLRCGLLRPWVVAHAEVRAMAVRRAHMLVGGSAAAADHTGPRMVLKTIAVADEWRRGGIGTRLLEAFTDEARRRGMRTLTLSVLRGNPSARALYERHGWRVSGNADAEFIEYATELDGTSDPSSTLHGLT